MNEIQIFNHADFGEVRTINESGNVLFCGSDVAKALGYDQPYKAIERHCRYGTKHTIPHPQSRDKMIGMVFIPEADLYRLVFSSKLPSAEKFTDWVTAEVLPSIRKHGAYMTPETIEAAILNPDTIIKIATELKTEREKRVALEGKVEEDKPKVLFAEAVATAKTSILIGELAKLLKQNGVDTGQNRLFKWLRDNGYLVRRDGVDYNTPTQKSMDLGLFEVKETVINQPDGGVRISKTTKVTGKGQQYFVNKFLGC